MSAGKNQLFFTFALCACEFLVTLININSLLSILGVYFILHLRVGIDRRRLVTVNKNHEALGVSITTC